jgi:myosin heavy subunit
MAYNSDDKEREIRANQEKILDLSNQINRSFEKRRDLAGEITDEEREYKSLASESNRLSQQIANNAEKIARFQIKSKDLAESIAKTENVSNRAAQKFADIQKTLTRDKISASINFNAAKAKERDLNKQLIDLANDNRLLENEKNYQLRLGTEIGLQAAQNRQKEINDNKVLEAELKKQLADNVKSKDLSKEAIKNINSIIDSEEKRNKESQSQITQLNNQLSILKEVEKSTKTTESLLKGINALPGISKFFSKDDVAEVLEKAKMTAANIAEAGGNANSLKNQFKLVGNALGDAGLKIAGNFIKSTLSVEKMIEAAFAASKESVNLSKNLGYGAENADRVRANFASIERSSTNVNVTTKNLSKAFNELSSATGFVSEYSADVLETQIKLTEQLGLSGDEAAGVYKFSILTGKSSEETYQSMLRGYVATRNTLRVGVPFKAAMAEASKVTGQLAANMGYNLENTIKGVVATKALGTSLEQAKSQGEKLLDFQSSIESELKAELITGQQLNLERARAAALMGDQVTVAEELAAQGMTAAKFAQMNTVAQKSYAEALGTTSDELANQLMKREQAIASGKSLAQITAEEADEAAKRQDAQTKFNAAVEKLQSLFGNLVAGPLGTMLELLGSVLNLVNMIFVPIGIVYDLFAGIGSAIGGLIPDLGIVGKILKAIAGVAIVWAAYSTYAAVSTALAATVIGGILAPVIGAAAAGLVLTTGFAALNADDMQQSGYGKRTILSPEGAIRLNDNDTIVAGTDLGGSEGESVKSSPSIDLTPMISAINEVTSAVNQLNSKKWDVYLDSKVVGTGLMQKSYKSA